MGVGRRGQGRAWPLWILKYGIFLWNFSAKMVVFLVSRGRNEISPLLALEKYFGCSRKNILGALGKIHYWSSPGKYPSAARARHRDASRRKAASRVSLDEAKQSPHALSFPPQPSPVLRTIDVGAEPVVVGGSPDAGRRIEREDDGPDPIVGRHQTATGVQSHAQVLIASVVLHTMAIGWGGNSYFAWKPFFFFFGTLLFTLQEKEMVPKLSEGFSDLKSQNMAIPFCKYWF